MQASNPDRLIYPDDGITKGNVVDYYVANADLLFPFVTERPLTLERYPRGIGAKGFMQKNAANHFPASIERFEVPKAEGGVTRYPVVTQHDDVPYLANQGTITFHVWTARIQQIDRPDHLVIDLDPEEGDLEGVRTVTATAGRVLESFGVRSLPVATGSKGYHVWVPLDGTVSYADCAKVARAVAGLIVAVSPAATTEFLKRERRGRVFVDWLRNAPGATVVAPFSLRPRPGAPVAMPLTWEELFEFRPDTFRLDTVQARRPNLPDWPPPESLPVDDIAAAARAAGVDLDTPFDRFGR